jgi:glycopeptide antibiotics resistance protein
MLVGWTVLIIVICSFPWWIDSPRWGRVRLIPLLDVIRRPFPWLLRDAVANLLLYIPLGLAYARVRGVRATLLYEAALGGLFLSMTCELYQVFSPVRYPSMTDVLVNTIGALTGASIARKWSAPRGDSSE